MKNLGGVNIVVWHRVAVGIRDSCYYVQVDHKRAINSELTSVVICVFCQNFYHLQWTKQSIPRWSDSIVFKWLFLPSSLYIMDSSAAKNTCSFNWIPSGEGTSKGLNYKWKKRSLQREASSVTLTAHSPKYPTPSKKCSRVLLAPDSTKFSPS